MHEPDSTQAVPLSSLPEAPFRPLAPGNRIGDRYEVRGVLGSGGYAVVYLAFDHELRREVALKVLRADRMDPASLRRFRREAAVARDAASQRLVRVFDIGSSEPTVYLTMEVIEGESLREHLARGPLPIEEAVRVMTQVLEGLQVLHALGIIHRDVKPGNILLTESKEVKLADFGLALQWGRDETRVTVGQGVLGTVDYVSPEQALGEEADARSDLYSCGVVLFEMLTGRLPYEEKSPLGSLLGRLRKPPPDIRRLRPDTPAWLAAVVMRLLAKDRERRHASAAEVIADLRPPSRWRVWRSGLRPSRIAMAAGVILLLAAALLVAWEISRPRFSHLAPITEQRGIVALDSAGNVLWEEPELELGDNAVVVRDHATGQRQVAAILKAPGDYTPKTTSTLTILDAETGEILRTEKLPSAAASFPSFADRYGTAVRAYDLDGDGGDEILVTYGHKPFWPSYTVLYEPRIDRARKILVASGHHWLHGVADLDGDRRSELLFLGINNQMGWYSGVAAVRIEPWVNEEAPDHQMASTPDTAYVAGLGSLLWYALAPRGHPHPNGNAVIDAKNRKLIFPFQDNSRVRLSFDGFLSPHPTGLSAAERERARFDAYSHLREANRLIRADLPSEATPECARALQFAERAADPLLVEWISRVQAKAKVTAGLFDEAEALFRELSDRAAGSASEISYDAGRAFHLQGELDRAVAWYRRGLGRGGTNEAGRGKFEFLEGAVLALVEQGRWEEGLAEVARYEVIYPSAKPQSACYREYVRWRSGESPALEKLEWRQDNIDLIRYWFFEFRLARGHDLEALWSDVQEEGDRSSETSELLASLRGEILDRLGHQREALSAARDAYRLVWESAGTSTIARGHLDVITERFARMAREAGNTAEADLAMERLSRWKNGNLKGSGP